MTDTARPDPHAPLKTKKRLFGEAMQAHRRRHLLRLAARLRDELQDGPVSERVLTRRLHVPYRELVRLVLWRPEEFRLKDGLLSLIAP